MAEGSRRMCLISLRSSPRSRMAVAFMLPRGARVPRSTRAMNASSSVGSGSAGERTPARSSPGVPTAARRPWLTMPSRSQYSASSMKWLVTIMVTPSSASTPMRFQNSRRVSGSTPEVGSSRNRILGACSSDAASARRCLRPSGRSWATVLARSRRSKRSSAESIAGPARRGPGRRRGRRSGGSPAPTARHRARSAAPCSRCASAPRRVRAACPGRRRGRCRRTGTAGRTACGRWWICRRRSAPAGRRFRRAAPRR